MQRLSFMELLIQGKAVPSDVVKYRREWTRYENDSENMECREYLGMTDSEYCQTHAGDKHDVLMQIVEQHRRERSLM